MRPEPFERPQWEPLPREGCVKVEGRVLLAGPDALLAVLRFEPGGTIDEHEHPGGIDVRVFCLEGEGWTSVGEDRARIRAGERVLWPKGLPHRLWTEGTTMTTLMFEQLP